MANKEHLEILRQGVEAWNQWRKENPEIKPDLSFADLSGMDLSSADLSDANLIEANLIGTNLSRADLHKANLSEADIIGANISGANLKGADLFRAELTGAELNSANLSGANLLEVNLNGTNLIEVNLSGADLTGARLLGANLTGADLQGANLSLAHLVNINLERANITNCQVFGISAWNLEGRPREQLNLIITRSHEPVITVDNLEVAQFVYLLLKNEKIRDVLQTIGQKGVLILGRFSPPERKEVLDAIAERLRQRGFLPIMFDFEKSTERDFTETIKILAGLSLFVIVDITNPKSSPLELQATVPDYAIPFVPIIQKGEEPFSMFHDLKKYSWVLDIRRYESKERLIEKLEEAIIKPAIEKHNELISKKAEKFKITDI